VLKRKAVSLVVLVILILAPMTSIAENNSGYITRGEFFKQIVSHLSFEEDAIEKSEVAALNGSPYRAAVQALVSRGIIHGFQDGSIRADEWIKTRDAEYVFARLLGIPDRNAGGLLRNLFDLSIEDGKYMLKKDAFLAIKAVLTSDENAVALTENMTEALNELESYHMKSMNRMKITMEEQTAATFGFDGEMSTMMEAVMDYHKEKGYYQKMNTSMPDGNEVGMEEYIVPEGVFMKMGGSSEDGSEWVKMGEDYPFSYEELLKMQANSNDFRNFLDKKQFFFYDSGAEKMNGKEYRKVTFYGKINSFHDMAEQMEQLQDQSLISQGSPDMAMAVNGMLWIDETTSLPYKQNVRYSISYGESEDMIIPLDQLDMDMTIEYSQYDKINDIRLPEEAKSAEEENFNLEAGLD
jgi:hypothetical protein